MRADVTHNSPPPCFEDEEAADIISTSDGDLFSCLLDLTPVKAPRPPALDSAAQSLTTAISATSRDVSSLPICCSSSSVALKDILGEAAFEDCYADMPMIVPDTPR